VSFKIYDGDLNKPQIKGETKLRTAVRGWNECRSARCNAL